MSGYEDESSSVGHAKAQERRERLERIDRNAERAFHGLLEDHGTKHGLTLDIPHCANCAYAWAYTLEAERQKRIDDE